MNDSQDQDNATRMSDRAHSTMLMMKQGRRPILSASHGQK